MPLILVIIIFIGIGAFIVNVDESPLTERPDMTQARIANETDPLTSLTSEVYSIRWGIQFWTAQAEAQSPLFSKAKDYCTHGEHKDSPNCKTVNQVGWLNAPREPVPEYGSRGGFGKMPTVGIGQ